MAGMTRTTDRAATTGTNRDRRMIVLRHICLLVLLALGGLSELALLLKGLVV